MTQRLSGLTKDAVETLRRTLADTQAPAAAKVQAARTLLEVEKVIGSQAVSGALDQKTGDQMSLADIDREIASIEAKLLKTQVNPVTGEVLKT